VNLRTGSLQIFGCNYKSLLVVDRPLIQHVWKVRKHTVYPLSGTSSWVCVISKPKLTVLQQRCQLFQSTHTTQEVAVVPAHDDFLSYKTVTGSISESMKSEVHWHQTLAGQSLEPDAYTPTFSEIHQQQTAAGWQLQDGVDGCKIHRTAESSNSAVSSQCLYAQHASSKITTICN